MIVHERSDRPLRKEFKLIYATKPYVTYKLSYRNIEEILLKEKFESIMSPLIVELFVLLP